MSTLSLTIVSFDHKIFKNVENKYKTRTYSSIVRGTTTLSFSASAIEAVTCFLK